MPKLSRADAALFQKMVGPTRSGLPQKNQFNDWVGIFAKTGANGIPARSGTKAGKATDVKLCTIANDGEITETSTLLTVWNPFGTDVAGNMYVTLKPINGTRLCVDAEDCP